MDRIAANLSALQARIAAACRAAGRAPDSVGLVAVAKGFGAAAIAEAAAAGQRDFGENYFQEALAKRTACPTGLVWHFIGPIQGNKTAGIAASFDWVHGIEREKIARRLAEQRPAGLPPLNVCLQVNISGEARKSGVAPADVAALAQAVAALPALRLRGLMAIPSADAADARAPYRALRKLLESLRRSGLELDTLSAGMSADFAAAIAEGATLVRIGTAIFGSRPSKTKREPHEPG